MRNSRDIKTLVSDYERNLSSGRPFYMDAPDLIDVMDYYMNCHADYDAETCFRIAKRLHPHHPEVIITQAYRLKEQGQWEAARQLVCTLSDQTSSDVLLFYFEYYLSILHIDEALQQVAEVCDNASQLSDYDLIYDAAEILTDYGHSEYAVAWLLRIPEDYPDRDAADRLLVENYLHLREHGKAQALLTKVLDTNPYDEYAWVQQAEVHYDNKAYSEAIDSCDYALAIHPGSHDAIRLKALSAAASELWTTAIELGQQYLVSNPADYTVPLTLAELFSQKGRHEEAIPFYERAYRHIPHEGSVFSRLLSGLAQSYAAVSQPQRVLSVLTCASVTGASLTEIRLSAASILFDGRYGKMAVDTLCKIPLGISAEEELVSVASLLYAHQCFDEARDLWSELMDLSQKKGFRDLSPYLAVASCRLNCPPAQILSLMQLALHTDPLQTREMLHHIFPHLSAEEVFSLFGKKGGAQI